MAYRVYAAGEDGQLSTSTVTHDTPGKGGQDASKHDRLAVVVDEDTGRIVGVNSYGSADLLGKPVAEVSTADTSNNAPAS